MIELKGYETLMKSLPKGIGEAEVNAERQKSTLIGVTNGEIVKTAASDMTELFIRVSGEKTGYAYTQDLQEPPKEVFKRALTNSTAVERDGTDPLNSLETAFTGLETITEAEADLNEMKAAAARLEDEVLKADAHIVSVLAEVRLDTFQSRVLNSRGVNAASSRDVYYASVNVMAEFDGVQYNALCAASASSFDKLDTEAFREKIGEALFSQYRATGVEPGEYPVVLSSTVSVNILMTAWQLFSGIKYRDGSSALAGKLGEKIGSKALHVVDVPSHKESGYRYPFDCEGTGADVNVLVDGGELSGLMHNLSSAGAMNAKPTANAGRTALLSGNIPTDILITPRIILIKEGERDVARILEEMGDGLYITESYDVFHSINIGSGDFSIPCKGVVIKDGKPHHNVTAMTICGNLLDVFENIQEAGNDLLVEEFLRKSYCVGSPSLWVKSMQVSGK